jgi:hypothetical protein
MPAQGFFLAQMTGDAGLEIPFCRAGVDLGTRGKVELTQAADGQSHGLDHMDAELICAESWRVHGAASQETELKEAVVMRLPPRD